MTPSSLAARIVHRALAWLAPIILALAACGGEPQRDPSAEPATRQDPVIIADNVTISSVANLNARRTSLINKVWGQSTLNTTEGVSSFTAIASPIQPPPANLSQVLKYTVNMPSSGAGNIVGIAHHYIPANNPANQLVILNPGHMCSYGLGMDSAIRQLMDEGGYAVLATFMPRQTPSDCQASAGPGEAHDSLFTVPAQRPSTGSPMRYFLDPIRRSLNRIIVSGFGYSAHHIAGLSGGALTATLYAALDTRISTSIQNTGTLPFGMHNESLIYYDLEQNCDNTLIPGTGTPKNDFYGVAAFKDLYVMASYGTGRRHIQVLNRKDNCCFGENQYTNPPHTPATWDDDVRVYEVEVRSKVQQLGQGSFRVEIDEATTSHEFSRNARVSVLLSETNGGDSVALGLDNRSAVARGMNGHLWYRNATSWMDTGFAMTGSPTAVVGAVAGHAIDVIYRDPFNQPKHVFFNGSTWSQGSAMNGVIISDPTAISLSPGRIDMVAFGGDFKLYHWIYGGTWQLNLVHATAQGIGRVALASWGPNRLDMFFRGLDPNVWHILSNGGAPYTLEAVGGVIKNYPTAVASATDNTLRVFAIGQGDGLWEAQQVNGGAWTWTNLSSATGSLASRVFGSPTAFRQTDGIVKVFARITGDRLGQYALNSSWSFSNIAPPAGTSLLASPAFAIAGGSAVALMKDYGAYRFDGAWTGLGGYVDR